MSINFETHSLRAIQGVCKAWSTFINRSMISAPLFEIARGKKAFFFPEREDSLWFGAGGIIRCLRFRFSVKDLKVALEIQKAQRGWRDNDGSTPIMIFRRIFHEVQVAQWKTRLENPLRRKRNRINELAVLKMFKLGSRPFQISLEIYFANNIIMCK